MVVFLILFVDMVIEIVWNFFNLNFIEGKIYIVNFEVFIVWNCLMLCIMVCILCVLGRIYCEKGVGGILLVNEVFEVLYV